jgi:nicotinate-nucleotide adenylyltransferase
LDGSTPGHGRWPHICSQDGSVRAKKNGRPLYTGLLGGSFNPAHGAHRRISLLAADVLGLDEVWWLVSPGNPLKPAAGMAPLAARFSSARHLARRAPVRVTALERELGTRFTADTLRKLQCRWRRRRFVWLMGADNLFQFNRWKRWRSIARTMPIAVVARPGYDEAAIASPAMVWLRRYRTSAAGLRNRTGWSAPALVLLRFDPDRRSATAIRQADPHWADGLETAGLRDGVTHRPISGQAA